MVPGQVLRLDTWPKKLTLESLRANFHVCKTSSTLQFYVLSHSEISKSHVLDS